MKLRNEDSSTKSTVFFAVTGLVCFFAACSVFPFLPGFSRTNAPDLLLCLCCVIPKYYDTKKSCVLALILGFLADLFINTPVLFSPVIYLASAVFTPYFYRYFNRIGTIVSAVCALPMLALHGLIGTAVVMYVRKTAVLGTVLTKVILPELIINFAFVLLVGFILKHLTRWFGIPKND